MIANNDLTHQQILFFFALHMDLLMETRKLPIPKLLSLATGSSRFAVSWLEPAKISPLTHSTQIKFYISRAEYSKSLIYLFNFITIKVKNRQEGKRVGEDTGKGCRSASNPSRRIQPRGVWWPPHAVSQIATYKSLFLDLVFGWLIFHWLHSDAN